VTPNGFVPIPPAPTAGCGVLAAFRHRPDTSAVRYYTGVRATIATVETGETFMRGWLPGLVVAIVGIASVPCASAQPAAPPPPAKYVCTFRYRIPTPRNPHVAAFDQMIEHLQAMKFEFDPPLADRPETDREDTTKNYMKGLLPSDQVLKLMAEPSVANIQLVPEGYKLPDDPAIPVRVSLDIAGGLQSDEQKTLTDQTKLILQVLGYREGVGYNDRGRAGRAHSRMVGQIPGKNLELLLKDLRLQPAGWFDSYLVFDKLPTPLRDVNPVHVVEVIPEPQPMDELKEPAARAPAYLEKISGELWEISQAKKDDLVRVQILFSGEPPADVMRREIGQAAPTFQFEGLLGNAMVGSVTGEQVQLVAAVPRVSVVRIPRVTLPDVDPTTKAIVDTKAAMEKSGAAELHKSGYRGKGIRIAIIGHDFRQWKQYMAAGKLPASTRLIDLTAERSYDMLPTPMPEEDAAGHGTASAAIAALASPEAEFTLIRIEPTAPYQIVEILGYMKGGPFSQMLVRRFEEHQKVRSDLGVKRIELAAERERFLKKFPNEAEFDQDYSFSFLGPAYGWVFNDRELHRLKAKYQDKLERDLSDREERYRILLERIRTLVGIDMLVTPYLWNDGFPLGGSSPLTRWFNAKAAVTPGPSTPPEPLVFQSAGNTRGQSWTGLYRDVDRNGAMEFAPPSEPILPGRWNRELNFVGWQPYAGARQTELPKESRLHISMQWREPHEPEYFQLGEGDLYRQPLVAMRITLLRQRDPQAKTLAADMFEVVGRSGGWPQRIQHLPGSAMYELNLDANVDKEGVHAIRIERQLDREWVLENVGSQFVRPTFYLLRDLIPTGLRPVGAPTLPVLEKNWEFKPRLYVEATGDKTRRQGRPILADYATDQGTLAVPADSTAISAVTAMTLDGRTTPYAVVGSPAFLDLAQRHVIFGYDAVGEETGPAFGADRANAFAAGLAASLLSSGKSRAEVQSWLREHQGYVLTARTASR
jgi:hypothetical protein